MSPLALFADASAAAGSLKAGIAPILATMTTIAGIVCVLFVIFGGFYYMTSSGNPDRLERAKKTLRNAFIGLVVVLCAGGLVGILQGAYTPKEQARPVNNSTAQISQGDQGDWVTDAVKKFIGGAITSVSQPILDALKEYTIETPYMTANSSVFNLWVVMVAIADVLFLLVVAMIGFRIMSASVVGLEDVDIRSLVPQIILTFIVANLSIFIIDFIIRLLNAMVTALMSGMDKVLLWDALAAIFGAAAIINIGFLLFLAVMLILAAILLIYYLRRVVILYIGAVLSPLVIILWLLPSFRDFAVTTIKTYISTMFSLFVNVVVLMLASALFANTQGELNLMLPLEGIATLLVMLKTGSMMNQLIMVSAGSKGMRNLGSTFVRSASHMASSAKKASTAGSVASIASSGAGLAAASVASSRPSAPSSSTLIKSSPSPSTNNALVTKQVSRQEAARVMTSKSKAPLETAVSAGTNGKVTVTQYPKNYQTKRTPRPVKGVTK